MAEMRRLAKQRPADAVHTREHQQVILGHYEGRKRVLESELATLEPPIVADVSDAATALAKFAWFWDQETDPSERNKLLRLIFETVTVGDGHIVSVTPREAFLPGRRRELAAASCGMSAG